MQRAKVWGKYIVLGIVGYAIGIYGYPIVRDYVMSMFWVYITNFSYHASLFVP